MKIVWQQSELCIFRCGGFGCCTFLFCARGGCVFRIENINRKDTIMKARKILNICAILTLLVLLLCFLFFSYDAMWQNGHYLDGRVYDNDWNMQTYNSESYELVKGGTFTGIELVQYTPLRGAIFLLLAILDLALCLSSLFSKKNTPDPKLHVVLPTITGIHFAAYMISFFFGFLSTYSQNSIGRKWNVPDVQIEVGPKSKAIFLLFLMLIFVILCFVKRSQRFFETETPIAAPVYAAPTSVVPQAPIHIAPAPAAAPQPPVRPAPVPPAAGSETPTAQPKAPAAANGAAPRRPAAPPNFKNLPPDFIKTPPKAINYYYELLQKGIITQEEFDAKKKQLLDL